MPQTLHWQTSKCSTLFCTSHLQGQKNRPHSTPPSIPSLASYHCSYPRLSTLCFNSFTDTAPTCFPLWMPESLCSSPTPPLINRFSDSDCTTCLHQNLRPKIFFFYCANNLEQSATQLAPFWHNILPTSPKIPSFYPLASSPFLPFFWTNEWMVCVWVNAREWRVSFKCI